MRVLSLVFLFLLLTSQAQASLWGTIAKAFNQITTISNTRLNSIQGQGNDGLYQVFNNLFLDKSTAQGLHSDLELMNSSYVTYDRKMDSWWGGAGDVFGVETTYTGSPHQQALGVLESNHYTQLIGFPANANNRYKTYADVFYEVQSDNGFMWVDAVKKGNQGTKLFSDAAYNYDEVDLLLAFCISDTDLLNYYYNTWQPLAADRADQLWLMAFDDPDHKRGDFTDLVAVVSWAKGSPTVVPIPGSLFLMSGGTAYLFFHRRREIQKNNVTV